MTTFFGDVETYSECPINRGLYRYAEDETTELLIFQYAVDDGSVAVVDWTAPHELEELEIQAAMEAADEVVFHHSTFDRSVLHSKAPHLCPPLEKWRDTMVLAMAHSVPGALIKLCRILNMRVPIDEAKVAGGKALINLFCKPRPKNSKIRRATRHTHPKEWAEFLNYAGHDVTAMRRVWKTLPRWNYRGEDLALWHLDQRINDRGIQIDTDMVAAALRVAEREKKRLAKQTDALTKGALLATTQRDKLLAHFLHEYDVTLPDLQADTIKRRLDDENLPWQVKTLLANRLQAASASVTKYATIARAVNKDGRVRGTLQFNGAQRTGRWAGRIIQPQNLMRTPKYLAKEETNRARKAIKEEFVDLVYQKPMEVLSASVPWCIVAPPGRKLIVPDLHQVEGRVLAWLAGETWKLDAYRAQDADPENLAKDMYINVYSRMFGVPIADVITDYEAGGFLRQIGKVMELALGYQGWVGAFASMAEVYGIDLEVLRPLAERAATLPKQYYDMGAKAWHRAEKNDETYGLDRVIYTVCAALVLMWRAESPATVQLWKDLHDAFVQAIRNEGRLYTVGRLNICRQGMWLGMKLPSGKRTLCYPSPKVGHGKITYKGINQYSRKWTTIETYGGKVAENATQATATGAGGLLGAAMPYAEKAGYEIIFHTHDELAAEAPDADEFSVEKLGSILAMQHDWTDGLPLSAGGYESYFYRKD